MPFDATATGPPSVSPDRAPENEPGNPPENFDAAGREGPRNLKPDPSGGIDPDLTDPTVRHDNTVRPVSAIGDSRPMPSDGEATGIQTDCVHAGERRQKPEGSISAPIFTAATYTFADTSDLLEFVEGRNPREEYGRYGSPNEKSVEAKLAALDRAESAIVYSSGMAAIVNLLMTKLSGGDEIVFFDQCYHRSREFCSKHLARFGVVTHQVPTGDFAAMEAAINDRTRMLVSESPTNPHLSVIDLQRFADLGRTTGVETLIDATLATPANIRPIEFGVDYVLHSATKYLGGHNDLLAGVLAGSEEKLEDVRKMRGILGAVNSGHNLYLLERGLKTFGLRMQRHNANGMAVARFLQSHPRVARVYYPGLEDHPSHTVASEQMHGFGGLVTFEVADADWRATSRIVDAARLCRIAPSLGGVESLIEQPLVMSYYHCTPEERQRFGITDNMIRLSCGVEDTEDLIGDLRVALSAE